MHYLKAELYERVQRDPAIFEFLQSGSLDGIWYWDLEAPDHEWMSPRFWETFGRDPEAREHLASEWQDMIHPDDLQEALANFEAHCADPDHPYDQVVRYRHADGSWVWVRCRGLAIRDGEGRPIRMLGAHTDVTELKRKEAELERSNRELDDFASALAHDLKEPLRTVTAFSSILAEEYGGSLDAEAGEYLALMKGAADRMQTMIAELLRLSRLRSDGVVREACDPESRVRELLAHAGFEGEADFEVDFSELPTLKVDPAQFDRAIQNLVANAIRFRSPDRRPRIRISGEPGEEGARVTVRDNGVGIAERHFDRIFRVFTRLSPRSEGTGMGLAIVQRIAGLHGGRVEVESVEGEGTAFTLLFPG